MSEAAGGQPTESAMKRQFVGQPLPDEHNGTSDASVGDLSRGNAGKSEQTIKSDLFEIFIRSVGNVGRMQRRRDRFGIGWRNRKDADSAEALGKAASYRRFRFAEDVRNCLAGGSESMRRIRLDECSREAHHSPVAPDLQLEGSREPHAELHRMMSMQNH